MNNGTEENARLLERYRAYLQLLAQLQVNRKLRTKIDLSGVVQQTLWEAHQAWNDVASPGSDHLAAWLRRILANNLADELRKWRTTRRDASRERSLEAALQKSSDRLQEWLAADQSTPSRPVVRQEEALRLAEALGKLPTSQRDAVVMRHLQGQSLAQIAEQLDRSPTAVAGLLKRGLQQLRTLLQERE